MDVVFIAVTGVASLGAVVLLDKIVNIGLVALYRQKQNYVRLRTIVDEIHVTKRLL